MRPNFCEPDARLITIGELEAGCLKGTRNCLRAVCDVLPLLLAPVPPRQLTDVYGVNIEFVVEDLGVGVFECQVVSVQQIA